MSDAEKKVIGRPFKPGETGNAGGRPRGAERRFRDVAKTRTYQAKDGTQHTGIDALAQVLLDIAFDEKEKARDRVQAACKYVDRGWGAVKQSVEITNDALQADAAEIDPKKMTDSELREAIGAIRTLKRLGVAAAQEQPGDKPTEH